MNPLGKIGCRLVQLGFRVAQPVLPYREPIVFHQVAEVACLLAQKQVESVLLVTDRGLRSCGATASLENILEQKGIRCVVFDKTCANPAVQNVENARELYIRERCQCLIAFGGGSSMLNTFGR